MKKFYKKEESILGIDLGSKNSGNTALCYNHNNALHFIQSRKGEDEFDLIFKTIEKQAIKIICIDAPLSLPGVYFEKNSYKDYFYRECDRLCKAMSPMFIGAFTARAIQLKNLLEEKNLVVLEVYPKKLVEVLNLKAIYPSKKENNVPNELIEKTKHLLPLAFQKINNMHQYDSLLCWLSGYRYLKKEHTVFGNKTEGQIIV
jgi:predicted nuclease with RNAse H fold